MLSSLIDPRFSARIGRLDGLPVADDHDREMVGINVLLRHALDVAELTA